MNELLVKHENLLSEYCNVLTENIQSRDYNLIKKLTHSIDVVCDLMKSFDESSEIKYEEKREMKKEKNPPLPKFWNNKKDDRDERDEKDGRKERVQKDDRVERNDRVERDDRKDRVERDDRIKMEKKEEKVLRDRVEEKRNYLLKQQELVEKSQKRFKELCNKMSEEEALETNNELYKIDVQKLAEEHNPGARLIEVSKLLAFREEDDGNNENEIDKNMDLIDRNWQTANEEDLSSSANFV
jgi:hypothetical protein